MTAITVSSSLHFFSVADFVFFEVLFWHQRLLLSPREIPYSSCLPLELLRSTEIHLSTLGFFQISCLTYQFNKYFGVSSFYQMVFWHLDYIKIKKETKNFCLIMLTFYLLLASVQQLLALYSQSLCPCNLLIPI